MPAKTELEARILFTQKKTIVSKASIVDGIVPSCNIHKCYHDEIPFKPCEVIERLEK